MAVKSRNLVNIPSYPPPPQQSITSIRRWNYYTGFTLNQLGQLMLRLGVVEGINLDGGGSSVAYYNGKVISKPTCNDDANHICERPVTAITCIR